MTKDHKQSNSLEEVCHLSIVIPVFNSEKILPELVNLIYCEMLALNLENKFELILINDNSLDNSWLVIQELSKRNPYLKGISLRKNFGQHNATMAGLHYAKGDHIVIMDDDLQHPPSEIKNILNALNSGFDVCYTKYLNRQHERWKKIGSNFNNLVATLLLNKPKELYLSSFKGIKREIAREIIKYDGPFVYLDGLILDVTGSIGMILINHQMRSEGRGNYGLKKSIALWAKMVTNFSILPLRLASLLGIFLSMLSIGMIIVVLILKFKRPEIPVGWASIMSVILFIGGIQTMCIGLIGEYLGRTFLKLNMKPQFTIRECTNLRLR